jgi:hypothetical protein
MGARVAVDQQYRRALTPISDPHTHVADVEVLEPEAIKHLRLAAPTWDDVVRRQPQGLAGDPMIASPFT